MGIKLVHINPVGVDNLYVITPFRAAGIDNTLPGGGGRPDQGLPGQGGHPDQGLPGMGGRPDQGLPGGRPAFPDNSLPSGPPAHVPDGTVVVMIKDPAGVWHYATLPPGTPAPTPLPEVPPSEATPKTY